MKVSFPHQEDPASTGKTADRQRPLQLFAAILAGLVIVVFVVTLAKPELLQRVVSELEERWGAPAFAHDRSLAEKWSIVLGGFFQNRLEDMPEVPDLVIDVAFKEISQIYRKREEALSVGHLVQGPDDFVAGDIRLNDRSVPVKLRLKGDWNDHLQGRKWSFRIRVRNGEHLLGMRRFSIQHPATRGFQAELMYFELLRGLGLMTPRYEFVNVTLNGEAVGLMALEEFFAKELLEHQQRREGVIVRFDESLAWDARDSTSGEAVGWNGSFDDYRNAPIDAIGSTKIAESPALSAQLQVAQGMLRGFAAGRMSASEVFDAQLLGRFIAASDVMGAWHATRWANVRFYLNPVTLKLEPIAFDATLQEGYTDARSIVNGEPILLDMLHDPEVWGAYVATLDLLAGLAREDVLQANLRAVESQWLPLLQTEFRMLGEFPLDYLLPRAEALHDGMSGLGANGPPELSFFLPYEMRLYPVLAHFEIQTAGENQTLQIENAIPRDVTVVDVAWVNASTSERQRAIDAALPLAVSPRGIGSKGQRLRLTLMSPPSADSWDLEVLSRITGRSWLLTSHPQRAEAALAQTPLPRAALTDQLRLHEFLSFDEATNTVRVTAGDWQVDSSIVIEAGRQLSIEAGTTLRFERDAALVVYGPVTMQGSAEQPISLLPANDDSWPGMAVLNANATSTMSNVVVSRTHSVATPGWTLTGGANFYESDVRIDNSRFLNSRGEDALNIIHSEFDIRETWFKGTISDAFDADFSHGEISASRFEDIGGAGGGDAIDVSGSNIRVDSVTFMGVADKALSIGERSEMTATNISIHDVGTGVAAKDGSTLRLSDSTIAAAGFAALTAYTKKPEYGGAELIADSVTVSATATPVIVQTGNRLVIDGTEAETSDVDVDALYETIMRPGLRE